MRVEHRSSNPNHRTPELILGLVRKFAPIKLDPCTTKDNPTKAEFIRTPDCSPDGLETRWHEFGGLVYVNPPYGRRKGQRCLEWVDKMIEEARLGTEIITLLPSRTDTVWFQKILDMARWDQTGLQCDIVFVRGRLTFVEQPNAAPFPSAIIHWGTRWGDFAEAFKVLGRPL